MKTFRQFTEDYVDSYALHRTSTGPGINSYVPVANLNAQRAKQAVSQGKVQKLVTAHGLKFKGKIYKEIDMELKGIDNNTKMVRVKVSDIENKPGRHMVTLNQEFTMEEREDTTTEE